MADQVRELLERHKMTENALRTVLVRPPVVSHSARQAVGARQPELEQQQQSAAENDIQRFITVLVEDVVTPLAEAKAAIPFFILSAVLDAMHRLTISPAHAFFLSLFIKTAVQEGRLYENIFVDGEPAQVLDRLCQDVASVQQYGVVLYNQALALECYVDLLYRADRLTADKGDVASVMCYDVMDVFCQSEEMHERLFASTTKALDAVTDALCTDLRQEWSLVDAGPRWSAHPPDPLTGAENLPVTASRGRDVRAYLLYLQARLTLQATARGNTLHHRPLHVACTVPLRVVQDDRGQTGDSTLTKPTTTLSSFAPTSLSFTLPPQTHSWCVQLRATRKWVRITAETVEKLWPGHLSLLSATDDAVASAGVGDSRRSVVVSPQPSPNVVQTPGNRPPVSVSDPVQFVSPQ